MTDSVGRDLLLARLGPALEGYETDDERWMAAAAEVSALMSVKALLQRRVDVLEARLTDIVVLAKGGNRMSAVMSNVERTVREDGDLEAVRGVLTRARDWWRSEGEAAQADETGATRLGEAVDVWVASGEPLVGEG